MEYIILYLCSIADSTIILFRTLGVVGVVLGAISMCMSLCYSQCDSCYLRVCIGKGLRLSGVKTKHLLIPGLICLFLSVAIPPSKSCYAIFGVGTVLNYINNSDEAKQLPDNALKAVNRYLESLAPTDSIK